MTPLPDDDARTHREAQLVSVEILGEFDRVCRALGIDYAIYAGTAIGAVRHGGFIPWDDDIDICILRADYERFLDEAPAVLAERYTIENVRTRPDYPGMFTKLGRKGTLFIMESNKDASYRSPIAIDIIPLDVMPASPGEYRRQSMRTWIWGRLLWVRASGTPHLAIAGLKATLVTQASRVVHTLLKWARVSPQWLQSRWEHAARTYEHAPTGRVADYTDRDPARWSMSLDELFPTVPIEFEGLTVPIAGQYDTILRREYGDYMTPPPPQDRTAHRPYLVQLPR